MSVFIFLVFLPGLTPPRVAFDPNRTWFILEGEHFSVYFSSRERLISEQVEFAREVLAIAEEVRATVARKTGLIPAERVHIIVADFFDYYNGWAVPFPNNTITIIPTPPGGDRGNDDNWLRTLLLHEYSHILQLEECQGVPLFLRRVFGRVILPNALMPAWLWEGYAVYNETNFSNFGRLQSAEWTGMILTAARASRVLEIDRWGHYQLQRYPGGMAPYLYGANFIQWLVKDRNGDSVLTRFNRVVSGQAPFLENRAARIVFGASFNRLWQEWNAALKQRADSAMRELRKNKVTALKRLTYEGFDISSPCWAANGREVYYVSRNGRERTAIKVLELGTMRARVLYRGDIVGGIAVSPDGQRLAFAEMLVSGNGYAQSDIFIFDIETGGKRRVTFNERARDPDFLPDSGVIVYVSNKSGKNELVLRDLSSGERIQLTENREGVVYHRPRVSPGGGLVAVGVWRPGGYADVELFDIKSGWMIPITADRANDIHPVWSRTGKFLFFVSDRDGFSNLYAYGVENRVIYQCSNVFGGVFEPAISRDNRKIVLVSCFADGCDLSLMDLQAKEWRRAEEFRDPAPDSVPVPVTVKSQLYYYTPLPTMLPRFWLPWVGFGSEREVGVFTLNWDVLQFHYYWLAGGYRLDSRVPFLKFNYEFYRYRPVFSIKGDFSRERQAGRLGVRLPFYGNDWFQVCGGGANFVQERAPGLDFDLFWRFSNARSYRFCTAPVEGRSIGLIMDGETKAVWGEKNRFRITSYWLEYFGMPPAAWSLRTKLVLGTALGDTSRFHAFQFSGQEGLLMVRGYPGSLPRGRNVFGLGVQFETPVWWIERGMAGIPVFFRNINTTLFWDAGWAGEHLRLDLNNWRTGVGGEIRAQFFLFHYLPLDVKIGAGVGLTPGIEKQIYFRLESQLLDELLGKKQFPVIYREYSGQ